MTVKSSFSEPHDNPQEGPNARLATVWQQFQTVYPTEESCREELLQLLSVDGFIKCHHCGGLMRKEQFASGRSAICGSCKQPTWYTAGTFFHHGKRNCICAQALSRGEPQILAELPCFALV